MDPVFDISIIISSFNRENKVLQTIQRLFESDFSDFNKIELIVIDDGSPSPVDKLLPQLKTIPGKIDLRLIIQGNAGIGATRNRGFREAKANTPRRDRSICTEADVCCSCRFHTRSSTSSKATKW